MAGSDGPIRSVASSGPNLYVDTIYPRVAGIDPEAREQTIQICGLDGGGPLVVKDDKVPAIARFDGKAWTTLELPDRGFPFHVIEHAPDGGLYATSGLVLYYKPAGENSAWTRVALPEMRVVGGDASAPDFYPLVARDVIVRDGEVWLSAWTAGSPTDTTRYSALLRSKPVASVTVLPPAPK